MTSCRGRHPAVPYAGFHWARGRVVVRARSGRLRAGLHADRRAPRSPRSVGAQVRRRRLQHVAAGDGALTALGATLGPDIAAMSPALGALLVKPPAPAGYPAGAPVVQPAGTNRFLLYFHKLAPETDLVTNPADPYFQIYQDSLAFQAYAERPGPRRQGRRRPSRSDRDGGLARRPRDRVHRRLHREDRRRHP